jgi:hypothetical protein
MPGGGSVRQAVLDHATNGGCDDAVSIVAVGHGQIQHVGVKVAVAGLAIVLGVSQVQIARSAADAVAQIVQRAIDDPQSRGAPIALGAALAGIIAGTFDDQRFGKVLDAKDAFGGIGQIDSGWHGDSLLALATPSIGQTAA